MTLPTIARALLRVRLMLGLASARAGAGIVLAGALALCAATLWLVVMPTLAARVDMQSRDIARARKAPPPKPVVTTPAMAAARLSAFYEALGDASHSEQIVAQLFDAADSTGVTLDKAEYKPARDANGRFETYTIILPVKGDYAHLRRFSEKVLLAVPYAALDDMRFRRSSASEQNIEANLRFTVFLRADSGEVRR
ncbi:hypothetical protein ACFQ3P_04840 [Paraburkholderia sabiae]|uniref:Transmembrane protein n=1 Tax=Paraburkholderia sabiae TaxID=273251 RepID=A0ABU9QER4_9BURK|nr:hypothetical protein [Paraburkholderia sabiae]WJZ76846.1 hypothetical protein QEN71_13935 [Paraburkholderia sabiae]CAD6547009.1 hypothetical protein LMG24235_04384 [Paraburkholderia sabiae]